MLVLSRRPTEKILFPNVGISVEIIQTKGNTVRVGIEAPDEVRILRGELEHLQHEPSDRSLVLSSNDRNSDFSEAEKAELGRQIDDVGLALALAQNQQRQGLSEHADIALEQAIARLEELKQKLTPSSVAQNEVVCEPNTGYSVRGAESKLLLDGVSGFRLEFEFAV